MAIEVPKSGTTITKANFTDAHSVVTTLLNGIENAQIRARTFGPMHLTSQLFGIDADNGVGSVTLNTEPASFTETSQQTNWQKLAPYTRTPAASIAKGQLLFWWQAHLKDWSAEPGGSEHVFLSPWYTVEGTTYTDAKWNRVYTTELFEDVPLTGVYSIIRAGKSLCGMVLVDAFSDVVTLNEYGLYGALVNTGGKTIEISHGSIGYMLLSTGS